MSTPKKMAKLAGGILTAALLLTGCGKAPEPAAPGAPQAEEKRLTLYTSFGADLYNPIAEAFTKETGIAVDVVAAGTGEMMQRIKAESANPQGDVMLGGGADSFESFRESFEPYVAKEAGLLPENLKAKDGLWHANNALPVVIAYNKNLVPAGEVPAGWQDLTNPKWQGKIVMSNAVKSGTAFTQVTNILTVFGKEAGGQGWQVIEGIVKNAKVLDSSSQVIKGVNDGEYALSLTYEHGAYKYMKAGGPVGLIYPAEGAAIMVDSMAVIKGAKHPTNARTFIDWLLSKSGQELSASMGLRPARGDIALPEGLKPIDQIKTLLVDQKWATEQRTAILNTWQEIITK